MNRYTIKTSKDGKTFRPLRVMRDSRPAWKVAESLCNKIVNSCPGWLLGRTSDGWIELTWTPVCK